MADRTRKLDLLRINSEWQFAEESLNRFIDDADDKLVGISHVQDKSHWTLWKKNTNYTVGDIVRYPNLRSSQYAYCTVAGQTDTVEPSNNVTGSIFASGTAKFQVLDIATGTSQDGLIATWLSGAYYKRGDVVYYGDAIYRCTRPHDATTFEDNKDNWQEVFASIRNWKKKTFYNVGDSVLVDFVAYKCKKAHTSGDTFDDINWERINDVGADFVPDRQYYTGDIVKYAGNLYRAKRNSKRAFDLSDWDKITDVIKFWDDNRNEPYVNGDTAVVHNTLVSVENIGTSDLGSNTKPLNASIATYDTNAIKYPVGTVVENKGVIYKKMANDLESDFTSFTNAVTAGSWAKISNNQLTEYDNSKTYVEGDIVFAEGAIYKAKKGGSGHKPPDDEYWESLISASEALIKDWKPSTKYKKDQAVAYNGYILRTKIGHTSTANINMANFEILYAGVSKHDRTKEYKKDSIVRTDDGNIYFAIKDIEANKPIDDITLWQKVTPVANIKDWESNKQYSVNDVITKNKDIYRAKSDSKDTTFDITKWEKLVNGDFGEWKPNTDYSAEQPIAIEDLLVKSSVAHNSGASVQEDKYRVMYASIPQWKKDSYYPVGSVVRHTDGGFYYSIANAKGKDLTSDYWRKMGSLNNWVADTQYYVGDVVWYKNDLYRAKENVKEITFSINKWEKLTQNGTIKVGTYTVGKNYEVGEIVKLATANTFYYVMHDFTATSEHVDIGGTPNLFPLVVINDFDGRAYSQNDIVRYNGKLYRAKGLVAANSVFNQSQWDILNYSQAIRPWAKNTIYEKDSLITIYDVSYQIKEDFGTGAVFGSEFNHVDPQYASIAEWKEGANYKQGVTVVSEDILYKCLVDHKSVHGGAGYIDVGGFSQKFPYGVYKSVTVYGSWSDNFGTGFELNVTSGEIVDHIIIIDGGSYIANDVKITITTGGVDEIIFESSGAGLFPKKVNVGKVITKVKISASVGPSYWYGGMRMPDVQVRIENKNWKKISEPDEFVFPKFAEPAVNHRINVAYNIGNVVEYKGSIYVCTKSCTNYNGLDPDCWTLLIGKSDGGQKAIKNYVNGSSYKAGEFIYYDKALYRAKADITTTTDTPQEIEFDKIGGNIIQQQTRIEDWSSNKDYKANDLVFYQGSLYRTVSDISKSPTFQAQWSYVNGSAFIKNYYSGISYSPNEVVIKDGIVYRAKQNTATTFNETEWDAIVKPATIDEWHANTPYIKGAVVTYNGNLWKAKEAFTSISDFNQDKWENLSGGGSGSVAGWKQVTKLNAPAGTKVTIKFKETLNFCFPPIGVLQLQPGTAGMVMNVYTFDVGDGSKFKYDKVTFDSVVRPNTYDKINSAAQTALGSGYVSVSDYVNPEDYSIIEDVMY